MRTVEKLPIKPMPTPTPRHTGVKKPIGYVSLGIIAVLLAVSVFLISNTVTIGISVRKEEINIMKYIGATDFFVRAPFAPRKYKPPPTPRRGC